ncbi:MAG: site-specific DNA-methyltransferase [Thermoproteota archaeon]
MARARRKAARTKKNRKTAPIIPSERVDQYVHDYEQRPYNPPVGLVTPETDKEMPRRRYEYDPHLDPQLQWAGKKEHTSFEVDTVSLHVHERIDPLTIIEKARKKQTSVQETLFRYFEQPENNPPLREAIDFYKHNQSWSNRLIAGDSLLVINSLLQKEGMAGKVQTVYFDPPYGIKYSSNFQPFVNKRTVRDGRDEDLTQEPEMVKAFRDTWELGIHSWLTYIRDRMLLCRELLSNTGSVFFQINDENLHYAQSIMEEVFGRENFCGIIAFRKTGGLQSKLLSSIVDYIIWYAKDKNQVKFHQLFFKKRPGDVGATQYRYIFEKDGRIRELNPSELSEADAEELFTHGDLTSQGNPIIEFEYKGKVYRDRYKTTVEGLANLAKAGRILAIGNTLRYIRYLKDTPYSNITQYWHDTGISGFDEEKKYVVQTSPDVIERCILMTTDPGDLVFDPTCGSGTTAYVSEKWGRRWITCDTSRVATALAKQRIMTAIYDYYELAHPDEGVSGGFKYNMVPRITLKSIARNEPPEQNILYDQPFIEKSKKRVSGPFTVEAVPAPVVKPIGEMPDSSIIDDSVARSGETSRQEQWRKEISATGILGHGAEKILFSRVEPMQGTEWLHADAETKEREPRRVVISFGPDYAPLEQKQVARALEEAQSLVPRPKIVLFAAFQFDPEAAKDIDEMKWAGVTVLRVQMNTDLLTEDLKKKVSKSQSFWLMGQPDVEIKKVKDGKYVVEVEGFDYYNTKTHEIESGDSSRIAMWMLDTDYDGRSLYPQQVFFPMAGDSDGWDKIGKSIKAQIDEELLEKYRGTVSIPFELGANKRVAVKIIDDRGIESLKILKVK